MKIVALKPLIVSMMQTLFQCIVFCLKQIENCGITWAEVHKKRVFFSLKIGFWGVD